MSTEQQTPRQAGGMHIVRSLFFSPTSGAAPRVALENQLVYCDWATCRHLTVTETNNTEVTTHTNQFRFSFVEANCYSHHRRRLLVLLHRLFQCLINLIATAGRNRQETKASTPGIIPSSLVALLHVFWWIPGGNFTLAPGRPGEWSSSSDKKQTQTYTRGELGTQYRTNRKPAITITEGVFATRVHTFVSCRCEIREICIHYWYLEIATTPTNSIFCKQTRSARNGEM